MPNRTAPLGAFVVRHAETRARAARQIRALPQSWGRANTARRHLPVVLASDDGRPFITRDDDQLRRFAEDDPAGFMRGLPIAVIDEIQRALSVLLALKQAVDEDPRPGRNLITGSADLFKASISPDSLAGRIEVIELLPFS